MSPRPVCATEVHEALKVDRAAYEAATDPVGWQEDINGSFLELRNCRLCHSTVADGMRRIAKKKRSELKEAA